MIKETAEKLLGRPLSKNDGINIEKIEETEFILGIKLPKYLNDFYINIGNITLFNKSFEQFLDIDKLYLEDGKLIFLEENQGVCIWGINTYEEDPIVYQNADCGWFSKEIKLSEFIEIVMYYQCVYGYEHIKNIDLNETGEKLNRIIHEMDKVVDNDHLIIYWKNNILLWYNTDEENKILDKSLAVVGLTEKRFNEFINEYGL
jgi:hypothetical protein